MTKEEAQELSLKMWENTCASVKYCSECKYHKLDNCDEVKFYEQGRMDEREKVIDEMTEKYFDAIETILHDQDLKLEINQALSIYARIMNSCNEIAEQMKVRDRG